MKNGLEDLVEAVLAVLDRRHRVRKLRWLIRSRDWAVITEGDCTMLLLTNAQKVALSIQPLDQYGNPAKVDGVPAWTLSDPMLGTLTPSADGLSAEFVTGTGVGTLQVAVSVDADLGSGVRTLAGTLDLQIEPSEAVSVGVVAGVPAPK